MKNRKIPMRRCVGCMESKPKRTLLRLVAVGGRHMFDPTGKANGRGIYLCRDMECFEKARKKKAIARGLGTDGLTEADYGALRDEFERYMAEGIDTE
jgi:predicted RNA-binding protein YlxR (DUF448 family)